MNARNEQIIQARAAGRPLQAIALEHGLSVARVSQIVQDHRKDVEIARLAARVAELEAELRVLWTGVARRGLGSPHGFP